MNHPRNPSLSLLAALLTSGALFTAGGLLLSRCADETYFQQDAALPDGSPWINDSQAPATDIYQNPCAPAPSPFIAGKVYAPNGVDPVAGASVHVAHTLVKLSETVQCDTCAVTGDFITHVYTEADGSFKLERVPNGSFVLGIQKGHFRRVLRLEMPHCGHLELEKEQTTLPGKNGQYDELDSIPNIAVISGVWDKMEKVLDKIGITEKTIYNGRDYGTGSGSVQYLLQNAALMRSFHMILINCGTKFESLVTAADVPVARDNLRQYVHQGGRLFVTDFSYDYVEQTFPEFINFEGSDSSGEQDPEEHNAAELGTKTDSVRATPQDERLKDWLNLPEINALQSDGTVEIRGLKTGWAVQKEVNEAKGAKVWVTAPVLWAGGSDIRPMTATYDYRGEDQQGCGRVLFTSYHTHGDAAELLPQERILEFLLLEIGACFTLR